MSRLLARRLYLKNTKTYDPVMAMIIPGEGIDHTWAEGAGSVHRRSSPQICKSGEALVFSSQSWMRVYVDIQLASKHCHPKSNRSKCAPPVMLKSGRMVMGYCISQSGVAIVIVAVREPRRVPLLLGSETKDGQRKRGCNEHLDEHASGNTCTSLKISASS